MKLSAISILFVMNEINVVLFWNKRKKTKASDRDKMPHGMLSQSLFHW